MSWGGVVCLYYNSMVGFRACSILLQHAQQRFEVGGVGSRRACSDALNPTQSPDAGIHPSRQ
jgi:hypothetical protein